MTKYREILRLKSLGISNARIADSIPCSRNTVSSTWNRAAERGITWETVRNMTDVEVEQLLFVKQEEPPSDRVQPDFAYCIFRCTSRTWTEFQPWYDGEIAVV